MTEDVSKELLPLVEECEHGHKFGKLPDHPKRDGLDRCPHCMAQGLDATRAQPAPADVVELALQAGRRAAAGMDKRIADAIVKAALAAIPVSGEVAQDAGGISGSRASPEPVSRLGLRRLSGAWAVDNRNGVTVEALSPNEPKAHLERENEDASEDSAD